MLGDPTLAYEVLGFVDTNVDIRPPRSGAVCSVARAARIDPHADGRRRGRDRASDQVALRRDPAHIEECERAGVQSRYSPDLFPSRLARPRLETPDGEPAIAMKVVSDDYRLVVKRRSTSWARRSGWCSSRPCSRSSRSR
jgi:hypothetical protein